MSAVVTQDELAKCYYKVAFRNPKDAEKIVKRRNRKHRKDTVYKCPYCKMYHIGSQ